MDHVKPRQIDGQTAAEDLAWSCFGCNGRKHTRTRYADPETGEEVTAFNPRQQSWSEHFEWSGDSTQVIGKTSCGRATVDALALNRSGVFNLRRLLVSVKLHPPG